ncbi:protein PAT1 homolog 1-like [Armigeres subalbatus]|uniref:protein PAT1 homolog 1-like n=1 Tax=Armigeres subalbatus TaxID=124917 RepID=UPI002ED31C5B
MGSFFDIVPGRSKPPANGATNGGSGSEGDYDAFNDETFGNLDKGDWENMHEELVRMETSDHLCIMENYNATKSRADLLNDDEFDLCFNLEDCDERLCSSGEDLSLNDDISNRLRLDPSIWDNSMSKPGVEVLPLPHSANESPNVVQNQMSNQFGIGSGSHVPMMQSVEDIERNIMQQHQDLKRKKDIQWEAQKANKKHIEIKKPIYVPSNNPQPEESSQPIMATRNQMFPPPPLLNHQSRIPVGFLPYNFLPAQYLPPMNNFRMHPAFSVGFSHQLGLVPHIPQLNQIQNIPNNQFNKKLVQEIQQNHPMLSFYRQQSCNKHRQRNISTISRNTGFDEYDNMMSNREKQWLIGIQLTQLNVDTPYINDYYFTIYKERLAASRGSSLNESKAYKDNQLNHPFMQPRGNAQLLLMSSLTRNSGHERKHSETNNNEPIDQQQHRSYTPIQFENSLGKLQCGSVKAPRKLIDMDVVGNESTAQSNCVGLELSMQRKSRHILLHIETLYKCLLKMEDMKNPLAMEAALIAKEKREKELSLHQRNPDQIFDQPTDVEQETFEDLITVLMNGLAQDRVISMLAVRKGKTLLRRICVMLSDHPCRWELWNTIFSAIPFMSKKDRDDRDGIIFDLYTEFERHVQYSRFSDLLNVAQMIVTDKVIRYLTCCKFLLSSIITIIFQMEVFISKKPSNITSEGFDKWIQCLCLIVNTASKLLQEGTSIPDERHTIKIERDNNIVRTVCAHLERLPRHVNGNEFLAFITDESVSSDQGNDAVVGVQDK